MIDALDLLRTRGVLSPIDYHFARMLERIAPPQRWEVLVGAALASRAVSQGQVCVDLQQITREGLRDPEHHPMADVSLPAYTAWAQALRQSRLVSSGEILTPLVLDAAHRLYLHQYFRYQQRLAFNLQARVGRVVPLPDMAWLRDALARLFPQRDRDPDWQQLAAVMAVARRFCVITGGPGTGKTTTVATILTLLQEQAQLTQQPFLHILLLAPTGKAAARLAESIQQQTVGLDTADGIKQALPETASTIHRALGYLPQSPTTFRHHAANPLAADVVVVDETSMVDVALMTKLVEAVPAEARLIFLGDTDQLASIEAGALLGDLCHTERPPGYSPAFAHRLTQVTGATLPVDRTRQSSGIWDCIIHLTQSYRFREGSGIGALARAINAGQADTSLAYLRGEQTAHPMEPPYDDIALVTLHHSQEPAAVLGQAIDTAFGDYARVREPEVMLEQLKRFRILCAHRQGRYGVEQLNMLVEARLQAAGLLDPRTVWYAGRPILITHNDYQLHLFNGDVGVITSTPATQGQLRAFFMGPGGSLRSLVPTRLPPHETVFAMTVHKSQGSEFDRVALLLPADIAPLLTRELLYTGVTRARTHVTLYSTEAVLREAVCRRVQRASGLRDALWEDGTRQ